MNRRIFTKAMSAGIFGSLFLKISDLIASQTNLTVPQIIKTSFDSVLSVYLNGKNWDNPRLETMDRMGLVSSLPFGAAVQQAVVLEDSIEYRYLEIKAVQIPILATHYDDLANPSENQKIKLAANLISNAIKSHDDILGQAIPEGHRIITSNVFRRYLGDIIDHGKFWSTNLETIFVTVPIEGRRQTSVIRY